MYSLEDVEKFKSNIRRRRGSKPQDKLKPTKVDHRNQIFLRGIPGILKNGKNVVCVGGKPIHKKSDRCKAWLSAIAPQLVTNYDKWIALTDKLEKPYHVVFTFYVEKWHKYDYGNLNEAVLDAMTTKTYFSKDGKPKHLPKGLPAKLLKPWIQDDTYEDIVVWPARLRRNADDPGCLITVLPSPPDYGSSLPNAWKK